MASRQTVRPPICRSKHGDNSRARPFSVIAVGQGHDRVPALYAGSVSSTLSVDAVEEGVEEGGSFGLVVVSGVVALAEEDGHELGAGFEVGAGLADGFHAAVEFDGAGA